jgi:CheY-like chemotaxis protein
MTQLALVIDDNPMNIDVLIQLLKREGLTPLPIRHPDEAFEALNDHTEIAVVFLDLEFPNGNGLQLIDDLRADPRLAGVPFVACTVHTSEQNEARAAGFHSFLGKPLNVARFPDQLRRVLRDEPVWEIG